MAPDKVQQVIEKQLGKPIDEVFAWIDLANPLGSASIAQVRIAHAGTVTYIFCAVLAAGCAIAKGQTQMQTQHRQSPELFMPTTR